MSKPGTITRRDIQRAWANAASLSASLAGCPADRCADLRRRRDRAIARAQAITDDFTTANPDRPWIPPIGGTGAMGR